MNSQQRKDGREEHREDHDNELAKIDEFRRSLRHKLGEIEKQIEVAANEGNEGRVRELKGHYEEVLGKLKLIQSELRGHEEEHGDNRGEPKHDNVHELHEVAEGLHKELHHLEEALRGAEREGNEDKARSIRRHMEDLKGKLEHLRRELHADDREREHQEKERNVSGDERRKLEYFREVLVKQLKQNEDRLREAQEAENEGAVEELSRHQENLFLKLREVESALNGREHPHHDNDARHEREHGDDRDEHHDRDHDHDHGDIESRFEHLHAAIEHLKAGGFEDLAHLAIETAEDIEREFHEQRHGEHADEHERHRDDSEISREDVVRKVRELEEHIHHLHEELEHVKQVLENRGR
ncbi:MAG: hypothetical protein CMJ82_10090 [Planctomycetaceae bacterium]|nr:hypothetical protein [Planctomycetaceae bacterium]